MCRRRSIGKLHGYPIEYRPLQEVLPGAETNPWMWFAWEKDRSDLIVVGVETKCELEEALARVQQDREPS